MTDSREPELISDERLAEGFKAFVAHPYQQAPNPGNRCKVCGKGRRQH